MMKLMKLKKMTAVLLSGILLSSLGCSRTSSDHTAETMETVPAESITETDTVTLSPNLEKIDYNGYKMTFFVWGNPTDLYTNYFDIFAEEETGDPVNDAILHRNHEIEDKYNVEITVANASASDMVNDVAAAVMSGDTFYDVVMPGMGRAMGMGIDGILTSVQYFPVINPEMPWWNKNILKETEILGVNYFLMGDINVQAWSQNALVYFNKAIAKNYNIENLYDLVRNGEWTLNRFIEISTSVYNDLDGDADYDADDLYGVTTSSFGVPCLVYGTGIKFIQKDAEGHMTFVLDEQFLTAYERILNFCNNPNSLYTDLPKYTDQRAELTWKSFTEDRALILIEKFDVYSKLREMESDFGMLPMPKYDETQKDYTTWTHQNNGSTIVIPKVYNDIDMTCRILEDMAYLSMEYVRPAYYETSLERKYARDSDSQEMLEIIFNNITYDLSYVINLPINNTMRQLVNNNTTDFTSKFVAGVESHNAKLQEIEEAIEQQ